MRRTSALLITLAAILSIVGCGGGSGIVDPGPGPGVQSAPLEGDVTQSGSFIVGATVAAFDLLTGVEVDRALTDDQGHYALDVPAGGLALYVASERGNAGPQWVNIATSLEPSAQDIELPVSTGGLIVGRVVDNSNGYPVGNVRVTFGALSVLTDGHGFYTIGGVGPNAAGTINVESAGYTGASEEIRGGQADRTEMFQTRFFSLRPTVDTGTSIGGVVRDIDTTPPTTLGGVIITLAKPSDPTFVPLKGQTNLGGVWRFYNIPPGTYTVEARRLGFVTQFGSAVVNSKDGVYAIFLAADEGTRVDISGRVFDENGTSGLANVSVVATSGIFGTVIKTTDGTGNFTLEDLVTDTPYTIFFRPAAGASQINQAQTVVISPANGIFLSVSLPRNDTGAITGKVTKTGQTTPPVGALVEAEKVGEPGSGEVFSTRVTSSGVFGLNGLPAGKYLLRASYDGPNGPENFSFTGSTDVVAGQITKRNITFP